MEKPCEIYLLDPHINEETRRHIIECGGISDNPVTGWGDDGYEPSSPTVSDTVFTIVLSVIISGLIIGVGYWMVRS